MSKEATGSNGCILGSATYFSALNRNSILSPYLSSLHPTDYQSAVEKLGAYTAEIIEKVYLDTILNEEILNDISISNRQNILAFTSDLVSLCQYTGASSVYGDVCLQKIAASCAVSVVSQQIISADMENALKTIATGGSSGLDFVSRRTALSEAASWGVDFAVGSDVQKQIFLAEIMNQNSEQFLKSVWQTYQSTNQKSSNVGVNGLEFASDNYIKTYEMALFPSMSLASYVGAGYAEQVRSALQAVATQIEEDVSDAIRNNDYVLDENGTQLEAAITSLEAYQVLGSFSLKYSISKLCWYTPIDSYKIQTLQRNLNSLRIGTSLTVDGVYGTQTQAAMYSYLEYLSSNQIPKLSGQSIAESGLFLAERSQDVLEILDGLEGLTHGSFNNRILGLGSVKTGVTSSPKGYIQISRSTYDTLRGFSGAAKVADMLGKKIIIADVALETWELIDELSAATKQADDKIASAIGTSVGGFVGATATSFALKNATPFIKTGVAMVVGATGIVGVPAVVLTVLGTTVTCLVIDSAAEKFGEWIGTSIASGEIFDITELLEGG